MKNKNLFWITLGGFVLTALGLNRKRMNVNEVSDAARNRALDAINGSWQRDDKKDTTDHPQAKYPLTDAPHQFAGGQINLIRAVADEADDIIKGIIRELDEMETRKQMLLVQKSAHEEMLAVAQKYVGKLTVTITPTQK
jgi:hypothetical protein